MKKFAGIEIGGTKLQVIVEDDDRNILSHHREKINSADGAEGIRRLLEEIFRTIHKDHKELVIGAGFGGPVNRSTGVIYDSFQVKGWSGFPLLQWLQSVTHAEVFLENDANVAAYAEATRGAGIAYSKVFYITIGSGIGSGFVSDSHLYQSNAAAEMEFGHIKIGNGTTTVENECSGWSIDKKIRNIVQKNPASLLAGMVVNDPGNEARHLKKAMDQGDENAIVIFDEVCEYLALAISHVVHLLAPDVMIVGGGFSLTGETLVNEIQNKLFRYLMKPLQPGLIVF